MSELGENVGDSQLSYAVHAYLLAKGPQKPLYIALELNVPLEHVQKSLDTLKSINLVKEHDEMSGYWMADLPTSLMRSLKSTFDQDVEKIRKTTDLDSMTSAVKTSLTEQSQQVMTDLKELENVLKEFSQRVQERLKQQLHDVANNLQEELKKFNADTTVLLSQWESELKLDPKQFVDPFAERLSKIKTDVEDKLDESTTMALQVRQAINDLVTESQRASQVQLAELKEDLTSLLSDINNDLTSLLSQALDRASTQLTETLKDLLETEIKRLEQTEKMMTEVRISIDQNLQSDLQTKFRQNLAFISDQLVVSFKELIEKTQAQLREITDQFLKAHEETIAERIEGITLVFADFSKELADMKGELFSETGTNEQLIASMRTLEATLNAQFASLLDQVKIFFENVWSELREVIQNQRSSTIEELDKFKQTTSEQVKSIFLLNKEFWDKLSTEFQESISELARLSDLLEQQLDLFMSNQIRIISKTKEEQKRVLATLTKSNQERVMKLLNDIQNDVDAYHQKMEARISERLSELKEKQDLVVKQSLQGISQMKQLVLDDLTTHSSQVQARLNERLQLFESNLSSLHAQYQRFHADLENRLSQMSGKVQNTIALRSGAVHGEIQQLLRYQKEALLNEIERSTQESNEEISSYYSNLTSTIEEAYQQIQQAFLQLKSTLETRHAEQLRQLQHMQHSQTVRISQLFDELHDKTTSLLNDLQGRLIESAESIAHSYGDLHGKLSNQAVTLLESQDKWIKEVPQAIIQELQVQAGRLAEQLSGQQEEIAGIITSQKEQAQIIIDDLASQSLGIKELFDGMKEHLGSLGVQLNNALLKNGDQILSNVNSTLTSLMGLSERQIEVSRYLLEVEVNTRRNNALKLLAESTESLESRNKTQEESLLSSITETVGNMRNTTTEWETRMVKAIAQSKENFLKSSDELHGRQKEQARLVMDQLRHTWEEYRSDLSEKLDTLLSQSDNRLAEIIRRLEESRTALSQRIQQLIKNQQQLLRREVEVVEKEGFKEKTAKIEEEFVTTVASNVQPFLTKINEDVERIRDLIHDAESAISSRLLAVENQFQETHQVSSHELSNRLDQVPRLLIDSLEDILTTLFDPLQQKNVEFTHHVEKLKQDTLQLKQILSQNISSSFEEIKKALTEANETLQSFQAELKRVLGEKLVTLQEATTSQRIHQQIPIDTAFSEELRIQDERMNTLVANFRSRFMGILQTLEPRFQHIHETVIEVLQHLDSELANTISVSDNIGKKYEDILKRRVKTTSHHLAKNDVLEVVRHNMESLTPKTVFLLCTMPSFLTTELLQIVDNDQSRINIIVPSDSLDKISPEVLSIVRSKPRLSLYLNDRMTVQHVEKKGVIVAYDDRLLHYWVADGQAFLEISDEETIKSFLTILKDIIWQGSRRASISRLHSDSA